jgi:hypothetical protein
MSVFVLFILSLTSFIGLHCILTSMNSSKGFKDPGTSLIACPTVPMQEHHFGPRPYMHRRDNLAFSVKPVLSYFIWESVILLQVNCVTVITFTFLLRYPTLYYRTKTQDRQTQIQYRLQVQKKKSNPSPASPYSWQFKIRLVA